MQVTPLAYASKVHGQWCRNFPQVYLWLDFPKKQKQKGTSGKTINIFGDSSYTSLVLF